MDTIIAGRDCEKCKYGKVDDTDRSNVIVHCSVREKQYMYGTRITCDDMESKNGRKKS